ncbi:hypothetical protein BCR36DRAFT_404393 [Piromyces finnis]|uniref:ELYS-like domain-containing protein n=1 Tax=Piromyces finnis TaxID=1754191 RepID=A0A1Y1VAT3_9FUNG|nr:hypothetical protein BCR36DRAFT_404393 [Piromyces finnis]|eukprot:ORX50795.1 hypothetical protein BCR36DRAFT_404393 [Piromyces finnis]
MIEADVNEFKTIKHIFDPKCEHDGGFNKSNDADWCYRWDSTFIEIRDLRSSEVMAFLPIENLQNYHQNKSFTQVTVVLSGNKYLLVVCVEDNNQNSELFIFDPLIKITVKVGNTFNAKITKLKVSDSFDINGIESSDIMYHFIIMSTSSNEIVSDLLQIPRRIRSNSIILEKNSWSFYKIDEENGNISALETCIEENHPILFAGFTQGKIISYYLVVDNELNTSLEMNKEYSTSDILSSVCSIIYKNKKLFVASGSYTEFDYSRNIYVSVLNLTDETISSIDFPNTPGKIESVSLSSNELFLYIVYIHKSKTVLKVISIEIMREVSEIDITQTYFTPATTAVSLRVLDINSYSNGICCDVLYLTKYIGYTDDEYSQTASLKIPRANIPQELREAPSLYTEEQKNSINIVREKMHDSKLFIELLLETMDIDVRYPFNTYDDLKEVQNQLFKNDTYHITGHCIIYYVLKDLNCNYEEYAQQWSILPQYLIAINGYWALDHQNIKEAFNYLWNPLIEIDWPEKIIQLLFDQKYYNEACRFIQITKTSITSDIGIELQMKLYLKTNILDAFLFQRRYNYFKNKEGSNLFTFFLKYCFEEEIPNSSLINKIRKFPYNKEEEAQLVRYTKESNKKLCRDFLLMYYIYHGKYIEAIKLYEENKASGIFINDTHQEEREALIQNLKLLLPKVQRTMLEIEKEEKLNNSLNDDAMDIDNNNSDVPIPTEKENPVPLSASSLIHDASEYDEKLLLKALKSQMLSGSTKSSQSGPFILPPSISETNLIIDEIDESVANSEINQPNYTNSVLNNLSPFSLKQNKEIKENLKQIPLISKQANENTQSSKMYSNALKRVMDDEDFEMNLNNESIDDAPMEIKKIDDYDGRIKKYYASSEVNKSKTSSHINESSHIEASNAEEVIESKNSKSIGTNDNTSLFSSSTQKSSRKTLKISN